MHAMGTGQLFVVVDSCIVADLELVFVKISYLYRRSQRIEKRDEARAIEIRKDFLVPWLALM